MFSKITSSSKRCAWCIVSGTCSLWVQDREKKADKIKDSGLTPEELQAKQEELFALSRAKFAQPQQQP